MKFYKSGRWTNPSDHLQNVFGWRTLKIFGPLSSDSRTNFGRWTVKIPSKRTPDESWSSPFRESWLLYLKNLKDWNNFDEIHLYYMRMNLIKMIELKVNSWRSLQTSRRCLQILNFREDCRYYLVLSVLLSVLLTLALSFTLTLTVLLALFWFHYD